MRIGKLIEIEERDLIAGRVMQCREEVSVVRQRDAVIAEQRSQLGLIQQSRRKPRVRFTAVTAAGSAVESRLQRVVRHLAGVSAQDDQPAEL